MGLYVMIPAQTGERGDDSWKNAKTAAAIRDQVHIYATCILLITNNNPFTRPQYVLRLYIDTMDAGNAREGIAFW